MPSPLASSIRRSADSRTWPTLPAAPSSSSTVAVWIESTTTRPGRSARAISQIRPTSWSARTWTPLGRGPDQQLEPGGAKPDLAGRFLAARVEHRLVPPEARVSPAAAWRRSVDLPIPGSPPTRTSDPGTRPPPRTRSSSPIPSDSRGRSASAMAGQSGRRGARRRAAGPRTRGRAWRLADDRLDQGVPAAACPALALPAQERVTARLADEAALGPGHRQAARRAARLTAPRPGFAARRGGCRGPLRGPCRR